jgi:hypothetical protein
VLKRMFFPKREEVTGRRKKLRNGELNNCFFSQNIIRVIKSRRRRWVGRVACMREMRNTHKILIGKPEGKSYSEGLVVETGLERVLLLTFMNYFVNY